MPLQLAILVFLVHSMRRYSRQGHLNTRIDRISAALPIAERTRPLQRQIKDRLSEAERAQIVRERREGASLPSLMAKSSLSSYSLRLIFAEGGIPPLRTRLDPASLDLIGRLAVTNHTVIDISRAVNVPQATVRLLVAYYTATSTSGYEG